MRTKDTSTINKKDRLRFTLNSDKLGAPYTGSSSVLHTRSLVRNTVQPGSATTRILFRPVGEKKKKKFRATYSFIRCSALYGDKNDVKIKVGTLCILGEVCLLRGRWHAQERVVKYPRVGVSATYTSYLELELGICNQDPYFVVVEWLTHTYENPGL